MERTFVLEPTGGPSSRRMKEEEDAEMREEGTVVVVQRGATGGGPPCLKQVIVDSEQHEARRERVSAPPEHESTDGMKQREGEGKEKPSSTGRRRQIPSASEWVPRAVHSLVSSMGERKPTPSVRCWETALLPLKTIDERIEQQSAMHREAEQRARRVLRERGGGGVGGVTGDEAAGGYALGFSVDLEEGLRECDAYEEATEDLAKACSSCLESAKEECERMEGTSSEKMGMLRGESERLKRMVDSLPLERSGDAWRERIREVIEEELDRSARKMVQEEREGLVTVREEAKSLIGASKAMRMANEEANEEAGEEGAREATAGRKARRSMTRRSPLVETMVRCKKRECDLRAVRHILLASAPCATWVGREAHPTF